MTAMPPTSANPTYAVAPKTLDRWARERLRCRPTAAGGRLYSFMVSGSTCTNIPIEIEMTVEVDATTRIQAASFAPTAADSGSRSMCAATVDPAPFFARVGHCAEALGLTLAEAAFRDWDVEVSGCLCTAGHRRHKWRNAFQTIHYAQAHPVSAQCP